jgi:hypothetical protein
VIEIKLPFKACLGLLVVLQTIALTFLFIPVFVTSHGYNEAFHADVMNRHAIALERPAL